MTNYDGSAGCLENRVFKTEACGTCSAPLEQCHCVKAGRFAKANAGKLRYSLVHAGALKLLVEVLEHGARKYAPDNWHKTDDGLKVYGDAVMRHLQAMRLGEEDDADSGLRHSGHLLCNAMFLAGLDLMGKLFPRP